MSELWDRLPIDTDESWPAFVIYRDMKPRRLEHVCGVGRGSRRDVYRWYIDHQWKDRITAFDSYLDGIVRHEKEKLLAEGAQEMAVKHMALLEDARGVLSLELDKLLKQCRESEFEVIKPGELRKLLEAVIKNDRLLRGESTENVDTNLNLSTLTLEELRTWTELNRKAGSGE